MAFKPDAIFIFSLEPWGDMWYSKHHYAAFLARRHPVYFISLPDRWRWTDLFSLRARVRTVKEGVHVVEYRNNLPLRLLPTWLTRRVNRINAWKLHRLVPATNLLLWCFHPASVVESRVLRRPGTKVVYHVVDPYQSQSNDSSFARDSDLVVAINPWYLDYYVKLNPNCLLIPHGVRSEDRTTRPANVARFQDLWGDYAVMAAGINHRTNYLLLQQTALHHPGLRLVIAGQLFELDHTHQAQRDALLAMPNVTYVGVKHPDVLRDIIRGARMGLVTYGFEPTRSVPIAGVGTPLKVITYLAQGCPVVSTLNSYVPTLDGHGCFKAEDTTHFVQLVGDILHGRKLVDHDVVSRYLDSVDYSRLTERILERIDAPAELESPESPPIPEPEERPVVPADSAVLIISNEEWNGPRYSKHRYALALNRYRKVLFIDPAPQWRPMHLLRWRIESRATPEGITVLSYKNTIPLLGGLLGGLNDRLVSFRLRRHLDRTGTRWPLFWSFDPTRLLTPGQIDAVRSIYHCADDHTFHRKEEQALARNCDHVFCIARNLTHRFRPLNDSVHLVPHGISPGDMAPPPADPSTLPVAPGYGLYIGNINDRHDFELWERLFAANPDHHFVIVGPVRVTDPVGRRLIDERPYPNVHFRPPVPYEELAPLITGAGSGFLYLKRDHAANRISSQKVVQFLAQGKPFFCSWLSEYEDRRGIVYMSDSPDEALRQFNDWRRNGEPPQARNERLAHASGLLFDHLLNHLPFRL